MSKTIIQVDDVTMRFRMNNDRILSLKEFVTTGLRGKLEYNDFTALNHVSFNVKKGETLGLIGRNGAGKSTMLKLISGILKPTEGSVSIYGSIVPMLELGSGFDMDLTGRENIFLNGAILGYSEGFLKSKYDEMVAFSNLGQFIEMPIRNYSSGMLARLAFSIASMVEPEVLIVDEILSVGDAYFQEKSKARMLELMGGGTTVLFVSHDRYFLDRIADRIVEVDHGNIFSYPGNYADYVALKIQRQNMEQASQRKRKSILKKELAWLARGARARSTKQKAHIQRIEDMLAQDGPPEEKKVEMSSAFTRMGKKTIELKSLSKSYGEQKLIQDFTYIFLRGERIGVIGPNGCGKSTLLKLILGQVTPDTGSVELGETIRIGYFSQDNSHMEENIRAIDYVREAGDYVDTGEGKISAAMLMERFLFDGNMQWTPVGKLSGGERRRLYLLRVLMGAPNVLILDEPTNDLDIQTLRILEDYLDSFEGIVITVSHDRYFLERVAGRIFAFEGQGRLQQYEGGYLDYLKARKERGGKEGKRGETEKKPLREALGGKPRYGEKKLKFTYKEQREYEVIEEEVAKLERELEKLEEDMMEHATNSLRLSELAAEKEKAEAKLEEKMERWVYLNELAEKIAEQNG